MKTLIAHIALAVCLLSPVGATQAAPGQAPGAGLLGATAIVNAVDVPGGAVTLWVHSAKHAYSFQVSPTCLYDTHIGTLGGLKPGMHVLVWTQAGQAGTLPVIYRLALQPR